MGSGVSCDFQKIANLGEGRFGSVSCFRRDTKLVAIKQYRENCPDAQIDREVESLFAVKGQSRYLAKIIEFKAVDLVKYLVMEPYLAGPLHLHIQRSSDGHLSPYVARVYISEILSGLMHLRECSIIHRDLKANNVLMNSDGHLVINDFGCANELDRARTYTVIGSMHCMAPEMIACLGKSYGDRSCTGYDYSVDWWAAGILLYEMLTGEPPEIFGSNITEPSPALAERCSELIGLPEREHAVHNASPLTDIALQLLQQLLTFNPRSRLGSQPLDDLVELIQQQSFLSKVDFGAVYREESEPGDVDFDRRLGIMELCAEFDRATDIVSEEDQMKFDGF